MSEYETQAGDAEVGTCHVCGQTFSTQRALSEHLMDAHPNDVLPGVDDATSSGAESSGEVRPQARRPAV